MSDGRRREPAHRRAPALSTTLPGQTDQALRLLCDAGAALSASRDFEETLEHVAGLVARSVADLCLVDVVERDGALVRVAAVHRDPVLADRARQLRRHPPDLEDPADPIARAMRTGAHLLVPEVDAGWLHANVGVSEHRAALDSLAPRSLVIAPLVARGRALGAITLISTHPARRFGSESIALAEELARRAALAVDHARLEEDAQEAARTAAEFLGAMTHEFRTPVHIVSMFAELLLTGVPEPIPPAAREHARHIRTAAEHLDQLVTQVLTFSRLESEQDVVRSERVDLVALVGETAALVEPLARQKGLGFAVDLPDGGAVAWTDRDRLRQVLFNLLGNAVKFTDEGEVRLALLAGAERVSFEVRDTGRGIAPEHLRKIFEPFWQVDQSSTRTAGGTGLGLAVSRRLAHALGGDIQLESEPGSGSTFTLRLPLRAPAE